MLFLPRACFLFLPAVLLFTACAPQAPALGDGHSARLPAAVSPERFSSENAPEEQLRRQRTSPLGSRNAREPVEQALLQAARRPSHGCGLNPGEAFMGSLTEAVRSNWNLSTAKLAHLSCAISIRLHPSGKLLQADMSRSSGNALFDALALHAVKLTGHAGQFPPPPSPEYTELELQFGPIDALLR